MCVLNLQNNNIDSIKPAHFVISEKQLRLRRAVLLEQVIELTLT